MTCGWKQWRSVGRDDGKPSLAAACRDTTHTHASTKLKLIVGRRTNQGIIAQSVKLVYLIEE